MSMGCKFYKARKCQSYGIFVIYALQGMKDRLSLTGTPELGLKNAITYHDSVDEYGHRVQEALQAVSYQLKKKKGAVPFL